MGGAPGGGGANPQLLWNAGVIDQTGAFFQKFESNLNVIDDHSHRTFIRINTGSRQAGAGMGIAAGATAALTYQLLNLGKVALRSLEDLVAKSTELAARSETLQVVMYTLGNNVGYSAAEMDVFEGGIKKLGITTRAARQILAQMIETDLDLTNAIDLMRVAQDAATVADLNSSEAALREIHGIATLNPLVLRRIGLIVDAERAYFDYAQQHEITIEDLTYETKHMILVNAVLEAGTRIRGAYNAAMETTGKRAKSLERFIEEFQLTFGEAFRPSYRVLIDDLIESLEKAAIWFKENKDMVAEFGENAAIAVKGLLELLEGLISALLKIPSLVGEAGKATAIYADVFLKLGIGKEEIEKRYSGLGEIGAQTLTLLATSAAAWMIVIRDVIDLAYQSFSIFAKAVYEFTKLDVQMFKPGWTDAYEEAIDNVYRYKEELERSGKLDLIVDIKTGKYKERLFAELQSIVEYVGNATGSLETMGQKGATALDPWLERLKLIEAETLDTGSKIADIDRRMAKELADIAKKALRGQIDEDIRNSRRWEDLERNHLERLEDIGRSFEKRKKDLAKDIARDEEEDEEDANDDRAEAAKDYARDLIDIEIDYQRELADIKEDAWEDIEEAARDNDAVAIARIMRDTQRRLKDAEKGRDRDREDALRRYNWTLGDIEEADKKRREQRNKDREQELKDLEEDYKEELAEADLARQKEIDSLNLSLAREKEDKERHRAWDEEDRKKKWDAELIQLGVHFASLKYINKSELGYLLNEHGTHLKDRNALWKAYDDELLIQHYKTMSALSGGPGAGLSYWTGGGIDEPDPNKPYDPLDWSYASGGVGLFNRRTRINVAENEPEIVAAIPVSHMVTHNFNLRGGIDVTGVSPSTSANMEGALLDILAQLGRELYSRRVAYA